MRVLVCGGRNYTDRQELYNTLDVIHQGHRIKLIIHGAARGADTIAGEWARDNNIIVREYPADWKTHGRAAGPIRNRQMLIEGGPKLVVAFFTASPETSKGTTNMVTQAKQKGIEVISIHDGTRRETV